MEFLTKPLGGDELLSAIEHAIERSCATLDHNDAEPTKPRTNAAISFAAVSNAK